MVEKKEPVLFYGDGPMCHTGFGVVAKHILNGLYDTGKYDISCLGINFWGNPHDQNHLNCYPTNQDPRGRDRLETLLREINPKILFTINDYDALTFVPDILTRYKQETGNKVDWVAYIPVDGTPVYPEYVEMIKRYVDYPVLYTKFAVEEIKKTDPTLELPYVYHGVDLELFKKLPKALRDKVRKQNGFEGKFVVLTAGVNQLRKQFQLVIQAFSEFAKDKEDVFLYMHTQPNLRYGWNLMRLAKIFGIWSKVGFTKNLNLPVGIPFPDMVDVYNSADVYLGASCGEGFGLNYLEAAACGLPVIYHNATALTELYKDVGFPIPTDHHFIFPLGDRDLIRPIPNVSDMVKALELFYGNRSLIKEYSNKSLALVKKDCFKWDDAVKTFDDIFEKALTTETENLELEEIL